MMKNIKVVIGANFGDEGKGLATAYFSKEASLKGSTINVLSNGGAQRGHTVVLSDGSYHIFKHFGSGTFYGADTYLSSYFIVNPMTFVREYLELIAKRPLLTKMYLTKMYINPNCLLTTPFDMIMNQIIEEKRGDKKHGSCGMGIWETILRNGVTVNEFNEMNYGEKKRYLECVRDDYLKKRLSDKGIDIFHDKSWDFVYKDRFIEHYIEDFNFMVTRSYILDDNVLNNYETIIFENGQGLLLDQDIIGYGKNTTPSNTGLKNPSEIIKEMKEVDSVEVCYISRTYLTRHGVGRFDTEHSKLKEKVGKSFETNRTNKFQDALRLGILDKDKLYFRCKEDFDRHSENNWKISFMFTHSDVIQDVPEYTSYISYGPTVNDILKVR